MPHVKYNKFRCYGRGDSVQVAASMVTANGPKALPRISPYLHVTVVVIVGEIKDFGFTHSAAVTKGDIVPPVRTARDSVAQP